jgi:hypothetical protein
VKVCENCRFWSQMVAQSIGLGGVEAVCLSGTGPFARKFKYATSSCPSWKSDHHGKVDDPPDYGVASRAAYAVEENENR